MKKTLDTQSITSELTGASAFFRPTPPKVPVEQSPLPRGNQSEQPELPRTDSPTPHRAAPQSPPASLPHTPPASDAFVLPAPSPTPEKQPASKKASMLASYQDSVIETIRKTVKDVGKEVTFVRLTLEEKRQLADIAYTYKRQGVKTSENEIGRIAINYLLEDYKANGQASVLAKVIAALLA